MSCEHCEMRERTVGRTTYHEGEPFCDPSWDASAEARIEREGDGTFLLHVRNLDEWNDEEHFASVPILLCPWCGDELKGGDGE